MILEICHEEFFNYLPVSAINNLLYVCRFTRAKTLNLFKFVFHLAGGFTSKKQWEIILTKIACDICKSIMTLSTIDTWLVLMFLIVVRFFLSYN